MAPLLPIYTLELPPCPGRVLGSPSRCLHLQALLTAPQGDSGGSLAVAPWETVSDPCSGVPSTYTLTVLQSPSHQLSVFLVCVPPQPSRVCAMCPEPRHGRSGHCGAGWADVGGCTVRIRLHLQPGGLALLVSCCSCSHWLSTGPAGTEVSAWEWLVGCRLAEALEAFGGCLEASELLSLSQ